MNRKVLFMFALLVGLTQGAWAESVTFNVRSWDDVNKKVVTTTDTKDCTVLAGDPGEWMMLGSSSDQDAHYYVVKGNVEYKTLNCYGRVHLILADNATLTCTGGIKVEQGNNYGKLFVYSQSDGDSQGRLVVTNSYEDAAGIGGGQNTTCGEITIHGGNLTVTGGEGAAGIGAGGYETECSFTGIPPLFFTTEDHISTDGTTTVYGGSVTATGGKKGAGIGGGAKAKGGAFRLYDGTVTATGGNYGSGIGGGWLGNGGTAYIYGGKLNAYGGEDGSGIGGGEGGRGGQTHICGGTVRAEGKSYGAGIGGGESYSGGTVHITGGTVTAIAGMDCKGREEKGGCAIGCGQGMEGKDSGYAGTINIPDDYKVTAGDTENNIERVFTTGERVGACIWRNYVKIEPCQHTTPTVGSDHAEAVTYTIDNDDSHTKHCRYCAYTLPEAHTFDGDVCNACGKKHNEEDDLWSVTLYRASAAGSYNYADHDVMKVVKGQNFTIPAVSATEGLTLMGYATSWSAIDGIEMKDGETLLPVGTAVTPEADMSYYPRYRYLYVPTWTWNDEDVTATLSIVCSALSSEAVNVTNITYSTDGDIKTATGSYEHDGATYTFTDTYLLPVEEPLVLRDAASNEEALDDFEGRKVKTLMLSGRTLYEDGSWNTLCLPFCLNETELYTYLNPSAVKTLSTTSYDRETGTLTLNFVDFTTIEAGKPYLIKWTNGSKRTNPIFNNVIINNSSTPVTSDYADFCGSFSPVSLTGGDKTILYLGADNTLYYPSADMTVGSCRAVFRLKGIEAGDLPQQARRFVLNFGDGETATGIIGIGSTRTDTDKNDGYWYDLQGRKLSGKPTQKGIYINHGNKVVIK